MENLKKSGLKDFVDMITLKGWVNGNTGNSWKAALKKILGDVADEDDVRKIDVKTAVLRYNNLHPGDLSPGSLKAYEKRVTLAIQNYIKYVADPQNYKAPGRQTVNGKSEKAKAKAATPPTVPVAGTTTISPTNEVGKPEQEVVSAKSVVGTATQTNLAMPFPLRPNYLAQIVIPMDMTKDEANRLCNFIQALAQVSP